jgi:predicted DNA binding protein
LSEIKFLLEILFITSTPPSSSAHVRKGGRKHSLTPAKLRTAQAAMANRDTSVADLAMEVGVSKVTLYR